MNELLLAVVLGATALSNFPRDAGGRIAAPAIGAMVGGAPAVVVVAGDRLAGFRADGTSIPELSLAFGKDDEPVGAPATADMDGDGRAEIAVVTRSGRLFLWSGGAVAGFPSKLGARAKAGVSFGDVDGDGRPELLVGDERGRVHAFKRNGRESTGWPAKVGCVVTSSISSSGFAGGRSVALGCENGKVHVLDGAGRSRSGFPLVTRSAVSGAPVFADLDDDGEMDLVVGSQDFGLYAVGLRGKPLPGFPIRASDRIHEGPAVADLDGDFRLDVVFASADGLLHAVAPGGESLRGFPVKVGEQLAGGPAIGDVDRDGALDVAIATADGTLAVVDAGGQPLAGFPAQLRSADVPASPLLLDLAGDGTLAAFVGLASGQLHALRSPQAGTAPARAPWPAPGRDGARTGRSGPNPPTYTAVALAPTEPRALDAMKASWRAVWLDAGTGEVAPPPRIEWRRDGKAVPALEGKQEVPAGTARRGERWRFVLAAPRGDAVVASPEVVILDTAPGAAAFALDPATPTRAGDVRATLVTPAVDTDGDALVYELSWLLDGVETGVAGEVFPAERLRRGALLAVRFVASDGELSGPPGIAQARVANSPPGPVLVRLVPAAPRSARPITCELTAKSEDPDGDEVRYRYTWERNGVAQPFPESSTDVPPGLVRAGDRWRCIATPSDGAADGPRGHSEEAVVTSGDETTDGSPAPGEGAVVRRSPTDGRTAALPESGTPSGRTIR